MQKLYTYQNHRSDQSTMSYVSIQIYIHKQIEVYLYGGIICIYIYLTNGILELHLHDRTSHTANWREGRSANNGSNNSDESEHFSGIKIVINVVQQQRYLYGKTNLNAKDLLFLNVLQDFDFYFGMFTGFRYFFLVDFGQMTKNIEYCKIVLCIILVLYIKNLSSIQDRRFIYESRLLSILSQVIIKLNTYQYYQHNYCS